MTHPERAQVLCEYLLWTAAFFLLFFAVSRLLTGKTLPEQLKAAILGRMAATHGILSLPGP